MIKAIVVDDEQMARDTIELFVQKYTPEIAVVGKAKSVDEAVILFQTFVPEIVFLDINMPLKNGFALFDEINLSNTKVIFTTAHSEYAIKALNMAASYYLLKPISPVEFTKALRTTIDTIQKEIPDTTSLLFLREILNKQQRFPPKIVINSKSGYDLLELAEVMFLEGDKNYTWICESTKRHLVAKTLKEYEEMLDPQMFFRCHQSFLVNRSFIKKILNSKPDQIELTDGKRIGLSRDKKKLLLNWLSK